MILFMLMIIFPDEQLAAIKVNTRDNPWYADYANFIVYKFLPPNFTYQQRKKFFYDPRHYFWDDRIYIKKELMVLFGVVFRSMNKEKF